MLSKDSERQQNSSRYDHNAALASKYHYLVASSTSMIML